MDKILSFMVIFACVGCSTQLSGRYYLDPGRTLQGAMLSIGGPEQDFKKLNSQAEKYALKLCKEVHHLDIKEDGKWLYVTQWTDNGIDLEKKMFAVLEGISPSELREYPGKGRVPGSRIEKLSGSFTIVDGKYNLVGVDHQWKSSFKGQFVKRGRSVILVNKTSGYEILFLKYENK